MDLELCNVEQGDPFACSFQVILDSERELGGLRDIPGVRSVAIAGGEQQDIILRFEVPDEPRARVDQPALWGACPGHRRSLSDLISMGN